MSQDEGESETQASQGQERAPRAAREPGRRASGAEPTPEQSNGRAQNGRAAMSSRARLSDEQVGNPSISI